MSTNFNNPFTVAFYNELLKKLLYNPPPHLKSVAALPYEIWMFNCTSLHDSYSIQNCDKLFVYIKCLQKFVFWVIYMCQLIYIITACFQNICHQHTCMLCIMHATLSMDASLMCCSMLCQVFSRHCGNVLRWRYVKWCQQHSEKTVKLK